MATGSKKQSAASLQHLKRWLNRPESPMESKPLSEHLQALRKTILICILAVLVSFLAVFLLRAEELLNLVKQPLTAQNIRVIFTGVAEAFAAKTKLSLIVGVVMASPVILTTVWLYIRPALHRKERIFAGGILLTAVFLFVLGIWFAYQYVFFLVVNFFVYAGENVADPMISLGTYVNFLFSFLLPFGIMFELPILIVGLTKLGLITTRDLQRARKYIIFSMFMAAGLLTPPDVVSQIMLGVPMCILYEVGVVCSWLFRTVEEHPCPVNRVTAGG